MSKNRMDAAGLERLEKRIRFVQVLNRIVFTAFCASVGLRVVATAFPQREELKKLESKLDAARQNERKVIAEQEQRHIELKALREDPAFLEIHARDRLDYCLNGERILRFQRDP